jgi:hypothetical protein
MSNNTTPMSDQRMAASNPAPGRPPRWTRWVLPVLLIVVLTPILIVALLAFLQIFANAATTVETSQVTTTTASAIERPDDERPATDDAPAVATTVPTPSGTTIPGQTPDSDNVADAGRTDTTQPGPALTTTTLQPTPVTLETVESEGLNTTGSCWFMAGPAEEFYFFLSLDNEGLLLVDDEAVHLEADHVRGNEIPTSYTDRASQWSVMLSDLGEPTSAGYESALRDATLEVEPVAEGNRNGYSLDGQLYCTI